MKIRLSKLLAIVPAGTLTLTFFLGCHKEDPLAAEPPKQIIKEDDEITLQETAEREFFRIAYTWDQSLVTSVDCESITLQNFLKKLEPDKWLVGVDLLPKARYRITVERLPATPLYLKQHLLQILEKSFHVKAIETNQAISGFSLKLPVSLPAAFKKSSGTDYGAVTSKLGYQFQGYSMTDLTSWLESQLQLPVECEDQNDDTPYDFEVPCDIFDPKTAADSLRKMGFVFEEAKLVRPVIAFEKIEAAKTKAN